MTETIDELQKRTVYVVVAINAFDAPLAQEILRLSGISSDCFTLDELEEAVHAERASLAEKAFGEKLASNQIRDLHGNVFTLRWFEGAAQYAIEGSALSQIIGRWQSWEMGGKSDFCRAGDAWFEKHR